MFVYYLTNSCPINTNFESASSPDIFTVLQVITDWYVILLPLCHLGVSEMCLLRSRIYCLRTEAWSSLLWCKCVSKLGWKFSKGWHSPGYSETCCFLLFLLSFFLGGKWGKEEVSECVFISRSASSRLKPSGSTPYLCPKLTKNKSSSCLREHNNNKSNLIYKI